MKIITSTGNQFNGGGSEPKFIRIKIAIAPPNGEKFVQLSAILDTGCDSALILPKKLLDELELTPLLANFGNVEVDAVGGPTVETATSVDLRIISPTGKATLFSGVNAAVDELDEVLIGMEVLKYFNIQIKNGELVFFDFDESASGRQGQP